MASNISSNISVKYFVPLSTDITIRVIKSRAVYLTVHEGSARFMSHGGDLSGTELSDGNSKLLWPATILLRCSEDSVLTTTGLPANISAISTSNERSTLFEVIFEDESYQFTLGKDTQLQILVGEEDSPVKFKATGGKPEILGTAIELRKEYIFPECSSTLINTLTDSQYVVHIEGKNQVIYVLARMEEPLEYMRVLDDSLNSCRGSAKFNEEQSKAVEKQMGPHILVIGSPNSGKTSFCHFLVNNAIGRGWTPLFIDLDVRRNTNSRICGTVSVARLDEQRLLRGEMKGSKKIFFFGSRNPYENLSLYLEQIKKIGKEVDTIYERDKEKKTRYSGLIVDICGLVNTDSRVIACIINSMKIDRVFIISDESYEISRDILEAVEVCSIRKSTCIVEKNEAKERKLLKKDLNEYFESTSATPITKYVHCDENKIISTVFQPITEAASRIPIAKFEDLTFIQNEISPEKVNSVLAVLNGGIGERNDLLRRVKYFVRLDGYDDEKKVYQLRIPKNEVDQLRFPKNEEVIPKNEEVIPKNEEVKDHILVIGKIRTDLI